MKHQRCLTILDACAILGVALAGCAGTSPTPALTQPPALPQTNLPPSPAPQLHATDAPSPSLLLPTSPLPSATPVPFPLETPAPGTVVLDFVALACRARWANGAFELPCPGDPDDLVEGYVAPAEAAVAEGGLAVQAPLLVTLPGSGGAGLGAGLFGIYPPLEIREGDSFHAVLACQEGADCDLEFSLEYLDATGEIHHDTGWFVRHRYGGGPASVAVDLSPLAGQTVQLVLTVRDQGTPKDDWLLVVNPYVARAAP